MTDAEKELRDVLLIPYLDEINNNQIEEMESDSISHEYERMSAYKTLYDWFSEYGSEEVLKLWLWASYLVRKNDIIDPIFFVPGDFPYPDVFLQFNEKRVKLLKKKVVNSAEDISSMDNIKEKKLTVESGDNIVILKRENRPNIKIAKNIYDQRLNLSGINNRQIEKVLIRYQSAGIRMVPLPNEYYAELEKIYGVDHHIYSTPLDNYYPSFGSTFRHTDEPFGSVGDIFRDENALKKLKNGYFELNLVHLLQYHNVVINYLVNKILKSKHNDTVIFIVYDSSLNEIDYSILKDIYVWGSKLAGNKNFMVLKSRGANPPNTNDFDKIIKTLGVRKAQTYITHPMLTPFEKAKVLGTRALHLQKGAPLILDIPKDLTDLLTMAEMELEAKVLPIKLQRPLPNGEVEEWDPNTMFDPNSGQYKRFTVDELNGTAHVY